MDSKEKALKYHENGKIEIKVTKPCTTADELSLAYTPGVAIPCKEIEADPELAYKYTNKGNLVAVVSDGTAVLGLGDIGAVSGKPVMEGKSVLFKKFANVDAFDIELDTKDADEIVNICKALAPTFGGINLEDISAPRCFYIEKKLQESVDIPVMHDDQHGTAIITTAALINALEITGKKAEDIKLVVSGAGASGIACTNMYKLLGVKNIIMLDSKGVIHTGRTDLNEQKKAYAVDTDARTIADALKGADMFLGLSKGGLVTGEMVKTMAKDPLIFALANPVPEIFPDEVSAVRDDAIMCTGRSDFPNQVNNVLGFPFIFRGALDVRAKKITEGMKMAAAVALAKLAKEDVPAEVCKAYGGKEWKFGRDYVIPKAFDPRVLWAVAPAVAEAAFKEGITRVKDFDKAKYIESLKSLLK